MILGFWAFRESIEHKSMQQNLNLGRELYLS